MINFLVKLSSNHYDYVLDKEDKFESLIPYLYPKLKGEWRIELVQPKIGYVRTLLDTNMVPEFVNLDIVIPKDILENLQAERPKLAIETKTVWELFKEYLANTNLYIEPKVDSMIYNRVNHTEAALTEAVDNLYNKCKDKGSITLRDVKDNILEKQVFYANQVFKSFILLDKNRWKMYNIFEQDLGIRMAFYTLRKYIGKLLNDKEAYLENKDYKDRNVKDIDAYSIAYAHKLFQEAHSYLQLPIILCMIEERQTGKLKGEE